MTVIPQLTQKSIQQFNTPQFLRGSWYTTWGVSLLLLIVSIYGVNSQRQAIKTVGKDAAPSVLTAQQLQDSFADMDASLANELLLKPGGNQQALLDFEKNRKKIADRLVAAAKNITYPEEERIVQTLQFNSSAYFLKLQEACDAHQRGDLINALNVYQSAANLMDKDIIPQAEKLSQVNLQALEITYAKQSFENGGFSLLIIIVGSIQIFVLIGVQLFLYQRMRRILNLPLLGATAIAVIFLGYTSSAFTGATSNLKIAKADAFDSLNALRKMRALSYRANADESRYLLDRSNGSNASLHDRAFNDKVNKILMLPNGKISIENIIANVNRQEPQMSGLTGLFATGLNNITFAGEREAVVATLTAWNDYLKIDKQIRQLATSGKVNEAIALCVGTNQGESNWAFNRYKDLHTKLMEINKKEFDRNIEIGNDRVANFEIIATVALGSIALLTLVGVRPRLLEYL